MKVKVGFGPFFALFLVFLTLKLMGYIAWSWWWVTLPLWWPFGLLFIIAVMFGLTALGLKSVDTVDERLYKLRVKAKRRK